jgi:hypothetical protein
MAVFGTHASSHTTVTSEIYLNRIYKLIFYLAANALCLYCKRRANDAVQEHIAVWSENHAKFTNVLFGQNVTNRRYIQ